MMRTRLVNETIKPGKAYATDAQVKATLAKAEQAPRHDPSVHPTATVSTPVEGIAWAVSEEMDRSNVAPRPQPTRFGGKCID